MTMTEQEFCLDNNMPKISVVIAVKNGEDLIEEAIQSIQLQDYKNYELIIIDGNSTDRTLSIVQSFGSFVDHVESKADAGLYHAMNDGIRRATGDLISVIGCDDRFNKDSFQLVASQYDQTALQVIYGDMEYTDRHKDHSLLVVETNEFPKTMIPHPTCFFSRNILLNVGSFDTSYVIAADLDFMIRAINAGALLSRIDSTIIYSTSNGFSAQNKGKYISIREELAIRLKYGIGNPLYNLVRYIYYLIGITSILFAKRVNSSLQKLFSTQDS